MDHVRNLAVRVLSEVNEEGAYANVALARNLRKAELSDVDRRFLTELAYGAVKATGTLDWMIRKYVCGSAFTSSSLWTKCRPLQRAMNASSLRKNMAIQAR